MQSKIFFIVGLLAVVTMSVSAQSIVQHEYWIDTDYAHRQTQNAGATANIRLSTSGLSHGQHIFNHRAKNSDGTWGRISRMPFYIAAHEEKASRLVQYEYQIDDETPVMVTDSEGNGCYTLNIDVSALTEGEHTLSFRAKNDLNLWSDLFTESFTLDWNSGLGVIKAGGTTFNVYSLSGQLVRSQATTVKDLPQGVYLVNGRIVINHKFL